MKSLFVALAVVAALSSAVPSRAAPGLPSNNVAWVPAAADADIDRAFARARAENKPLLLYWGATWCPPCNQLKATLFNRQDFAAQSRAFVAVHVDGDRPAAQKISQRFKVSGYPTLVLFRPDGQEITRLPGEVEPAQVMAVLHLGMSGGRPVKAVLADALAGRAIADNEWRLLAYYSWETDEQQLLPQAERAATLARLAADSPSQDPETGLRLSLKALAAGAKPDAALRPRIERLLADATQARLHADVLSGSTVEIVKALSADDAPERAVLVNAFDGALRRLAADPTLSRGDRIGALVARVELARLGQPREDAHPRMPQALLDDVRAHATRDDREITDGYERQAVVTAAAYALGRAGLWADSDAMLQANLARSHSPYYLMSQLGGNARRQGRTEEALRWFGQAFDKSEGPATRLQWGASYVAALVDLAPQDAARIEKVAGQLIREAGRDAGAFEGRSLRSLQRMSGKLVSWGGEGARAAAVKRLQARLSPLCTKAGTAQGQRAACQALLKPKDAKDGKDNKA